MSSSETHERRWLCADYRFVQPVTYRSLRDAGLPPALQAATLGAFPRINGLLQPARVNAMSSRWRRRVCINRARELSAHVPGKTGR